MTDSTAMLRALVECRRARLTQLEEQRAAMDEEITAITRYLKLLEPLLILEGIIPPPDDVPGYRSGGNRQRHTPRRRVPYADRSLPFAITSLLTTHATLRHSEIVHAIYEIQSNSDYMRASSTVSSTMTLGCKLGIWERVSVGVFRRGPASPTPTEATP